MIPKIVHTRFELKACTVKLTKLCDTQLEAVSNHLQWQYDTIEALQAEISRLNTKLALSAMHVTAMRYRPSKHV
jgi:hypothetical protein